MKTMNTTVKGIAIGVLMATSIGVASAATLITEWGYDNRLGFTLSAPGGVTQDDFFTIIDANTLAPDFNNAALEAAGTLRWGNDAGSGQSSLVSGQRVTSDPGAVPARPNLFTGVGDFGDAVEGVTLTHNNVPIFAPSLSSATLLDVIYLTPLDPLLSALPPTAVEFDIVFFETPNQTDSNGVPIAGTTCADGTANGVGDNVNGCADIFVVTGPADFIGDGFLTVKTENILGYVYTFKIEAEGLGPLSAEACTAVGQLAGCQGWLTIENQSNTLRPFFSVRADLVPVPAPATMLLFGAGLLALGATVRRRRS